MRSHLNFSNVVALLALFVALGGTSYAALTVTGKTVKNGSLTGQDLKRGTITSRQVKDGGLLSADFKAGQLPAGPRGETGPAGPPGTPGQAGPAGSFSSVVARKLFGSVADGAQTALTVVCAAGERPISGGFDAASDGTVRALLSAPANGPLSASPGDGQTFDRWQVVVRNDAGGAANASFIAYAICAS